MRNLVPGRIVPGFMKNLGDSEYLSRLRTFILVVYMLIDVISQENN